jgi:hypothetical protein
MGILAIFETARTIEDPQQLQSGSPCLVDENSLGQLKAFAGRVHGEYLYGALSTSTARWGHRPGWLSGPLVEQNGSFA